MPPTELSGKELTTFGEVFAASPLGMALLGPDGRFVKANPAFCSALGGTGPEWLLALAFTDISHPDDLPECRQWIQDLLENRIGRVRLERRYLHRAGHWIWGEVHLSRVGEEGGKPRLLLVCFQDIQERKQAELAMRKSCATLGQILDTIPQSVFWKDSQGRYLGCNKPFAVQAGLESPEKIVGKTDFDLPWPREDSVAYRADDLKVMECNQPRPHIVEPLRQADGTRLWIETSKVPLVGEDGKTFGVLGVYGDITERKVAEDAVQASQDRLAEAQALAHLGNWELDMKSGALTWSDEIYRIFEIDPDRFGASYDAFLAAIHPDDREVVHRTFTESVSQRTPYQIVHRLLHSGGTVKYVEERGQTIYDSDGTPLHSMGTVQDITDRKRAEEAIRANQMRLTEAQALAHMGSWEMDLQAKVGIWSEEFWRIFGLDPEKNVATEQLLRSRVHPEDRDAVARTFDQASTDGRPFRMVHRLLLDDGTVKYVEARGQTVRDAGGKPLRSVGTVLDITDLKRIEESQRETEERLRILSDNLPGGMVYQIDSGEDGASRVFTYVSAGVQLLHDLTPTQVRNDARVFYRQIHEDDQGTLAEKERVAVAGMAPFQCEYRIRKPAGEIRWCFATSSPRRLGNGHLVWDGIEIDITERKRAEEQQRLLSSQLQQSQKMESLGSLAGGVAHDLNNVLAAILSLSSTFRARTSSTDPMAMALDTISSACMRGRDVVRSLLVFARRELEAEGPVDLNALVGETVRLLSHTTLKRATLVTELLEPLPAILGDNSALSHALINLCVNAVDAMPHGGTITLSTARGLEGEVVLKVRDTGTGMNPDVLEKATEPFFTTKPQGQGTGLGLSMVYGTMQAHDGQVTIHSRPGEGTEVALVFPAHRVLAGVPSKAPPAGESAGSPRLRVLLVDDDDLVLSSQQAVLEMLGHGVTPAPGGEEAIHLLEEGLEVDLVILDMNMPGMSGAETLRRIMILRPHQQVVIASGYLDDQARDLKSIYPTLRFIGKPYSIGELRRIIGG